MAQKSKFQNVLIVEGKNDQHILWNLLEVHDVTESFEVKISGGNHTGSDEAVLDEFKIRLKNEQPVTFGIIIDADRNATSRWQSVKGLLKSSGYSEIPDEIPREGGVFSEKDKSRVGVWIMPDNFSPGMIEDFAISLISEDDLLWQRTNRTVDEIPVPEAEPIPGADQRRFKEVHLSKAKIHTFLAWHDEPGQPIGIALKKRNALQSDALPAKDLIAWIKRLFELE